MSLERQLGLRDIVLFNVAAVLSLRWIALAAGAGPSSLALWLLAAVALFLPFGFAMAALASAFPEEGGLYVWSKLAFGERQGFVCGFCYFMSNVTYFPGSLVAGVVYALYVFGSRFASLEKSNLYVIASSLIALAVVLAFNLVGMKTGRWVQNLGGIAQWGPPVILLAVGVAALIKSGSATAIDAHSLIPKFAKLDDVSFFAQMCLAFVGLELAPVLGGEVKDPQRTFPRAILLSAATIVGCYMLGTLALMWALPSSETSIIAGINQAADKAGVAHGIMWLGPAVALLMTLATMGSVGAYLVGNARMMFVGGLDRYLPPAFGRIHPRWKTPHVALLAQAVLVALLVVAANQGTTVKSAYLKLVNATIILVFIPYLYIFAALIKMRKKIAATPGAVPVPGGAWGTWVWAVLGSLMTLVGMVLAMVPPPDTADKTSFFLQVVGGSFGFLLAGFVIYEVKKWKSGNRRDTPAT